MPHDPPHLSNDLLELRRTDAGARNWRWSFGEAMLDEAALELTVAGDVVALEPKALELLRVLLRRPGEVVTKDELLDAVWPGRVVTEGVLGKAVAKLRTALRDGEGLTVRTAHGYGYRLLADVRAEPIERSAEPGTLALDSGQPVAGRRHWRLRRRLGGGGHGEVWLAEHEKTREQRVLKFARNGRSLAALKREVTLFRLFLDTLGERPDLAPVLDWNFDEAPYFIESPFAPNGSLLDYADRLGGIATLPMSTRLELAAQIADALAAAHSVGVLHKDLKPGNVLVYAERDTSMPRAQLTDFGSAFLVDSNRLEALGITRLGYTRTSDGANDDASSGTPLYLAPERIAGHAATSRSDVYALGVLLWQLITGDLRRPLAAGWEREVEDPLLRTDIADCIDGDPARRLDSATTLAQRLRRLEQRALECRQAAERDALAAQLAAGLARSRVRRRWLAGLSATLAVGLLATATLYVQLLQSQHRTAQAAERTQAINAFLVEDLLSFVDPLSSGRSEPTLRAAFEHAAKSIPRRFSGQPDNEAAVRRALGVGHLARGELEAAQAQFTLAAKRIAGVGSDPDLALDIRCQLAEVAFARGEHARARELLGDPDALRVHPGASAAQFHAARLSAQVERRTGHVDAAIARFAALVDVALVQYGADASETLALQRHYADSLRVGARLDEARVLSARLLGRATQRYGTGDIRLAPYLELLAKVDAQLGHHERALELLGEADAINARSLPPGHSAVWAVREQMIAAHMALGQSDEALAMAEQVWTELVSTTPTGVDGLRVLGNLAKQIAHLINQDLGIERAAHVAELWREQHPADYPEAIGQRQQLARLLQHAGRWREAETHQRELASVAAVALAADSAGRAWTHLEWAESLYHLGRAEEAYRQFNAGLAIAEKQSAGGNPLPDVARYRALRDRLGKGSTESKALLVTPPG